MRRYLRNGMLVGAVAVCTYLAGNVLSYYHTRSWVLPLADYTMSPQRSVQAFREAQQEDPLWGHVFHLGEHIACERYLAEAPRIRETDVEMPQRKPPGDLEENLASTDTPPAP